MNNTTQLILTPLKPALIAGHAQRLPVLIRVQTPDPEPGTQTARKPYHLALVIDRSGSMSGAPLQEAVRCARHMVDRLAPADRASLITFDDTVRTLVPAAPVGDRKALHAMLDRIHSGGSTNLCGGWQAGAGELLPDAASAALSRIILLSDGNANVGEITGTDQITALCEPLARQGVTTSTYGLGRDFNEDLMVGMARQGQGNHYYGDTAADLFEPFAEEFDLIANLHSRQVRLSLGAPEGIRLRLLNDYPVEAREGFPVVRLPDIPWGAEAWALVELEISAELATTELCQLLQAEVSASTPDGQPVAYPEGRLALAGVSATAWDTLLADPLVAERQAELAAAQLLAQARAAADAGDWKTIERLLADARTRYAGFPWVAEILETMAVIAAEQDTERFRKEALYSSSKMSRRLSAKEEMTSLSAESGKAAFLRRKKSQGKAQFPRPEDSQP